MIAGLLQMTLNYSFYSNGEMSEWLSAYAAKPLD